MGKVTRRYVERAHVPETFTLSTNERLQFLANLIVDEIEREMLDVVR